MEILIILITLVILLAILTIGVNELSKDEYDSVGFTLIASIILAFIVLVATLCLKDNPKAIDVYRGATTLEITYRNGVPVDSTVVWKSK